MTDTMSLAARIKELCDEAEKSYLTAHTRFYNFPETYDPPDKRLDRFASALRDAVNALEKVDSYHPRGTSSINIWMIAENALASIATALELEASE